MKPKILIIDWKPIAYHSRLGEFLDIEKVDLSLKPYKIAEGLGDKVGLIAHNISLGEYRVVFRKLRERKLPSIIENSSPLIHNRNKEIIKRNPQDFGQIFFRGYYDEVIEKAREIFLK